MNQSFLLEQLVKNKIVIIKYSADWCKSCQIKAFVDAYNDLRFMYFDIIKFIEIDYDDIKNTNIMDNETLSPHKIPNIKLFIDGDLVADEIGINSVKTIERKLMERDLIKSI